MVTSIVDVHPHDKPSIDATLPMATLMATLISQSPTGQYPIYRWCVIMLMEDFRLQIDEHHWLASVTHLFSNDGSPTCFSHVTPGGSAPPGRPSSRAGPSKRVNVDPQRWLNDVAYRQVLVCKNSTSERQRCPVVGRFWQVAKGRMVDDWPASHVWLLWRVYFFHDIGFFFLDWC